MIKEFVELFMDRKPELESMFRVKHPSDYRELITNVVTLLEAAGECPSPERIHEIDDGHYQGTLVYVIGASGYQPTDYWYVKIAYGSCSACDTLESIRHYSDDTPTEQQINEYMTLCLHVVQGLKKMNGGEV